MMTGADYKASLNDGRATYFDGRKIGDLVSERVLGQTVTVVAEGYDRWRAVTNIQTGGGLYAQRIVTRKHYDLDAAKQRALGAAGIENNGAQR